MKNLSTGTGLAILGLGIACYPILDRLAPVDRSAHAGAPLAAEAKSAMGQADPTIVWMGVSTLSYSQKHYFHRMWSDGRIETRDVSFNYGPCGGDHFVCGSDWIEVPPPPAGNGFACRADLNGDRKVDGADLGMILGGWGDHVACPPEPTYPCFDFAGGGFR